MANTGVDALPSVIAANLTMQQDSFKIKGQATTIGFVSFLGKPVAAENSPLVDILLANGAILYIKTNIPQTLLVRSCRFFCLAVLC